MSEVSKFVKQFDYLEEKIGEKRAIFYDLKDGEIQRKSWIKLILSVIFLLNKYRKKREFNNLEVKLIKHYKHCLAHDSVPEKVYTITKRILPEKPLKENTPKLYAALQKLFPNASGDKLKILEHLYQDNIRRFFGKRSRHFSHSLPFPSGAIC